ncbi:MAG: Gfo/Idh/MocA family oxidoreductase [Phycisphaerales bacterium]|nr:MAG: Gfo/Idh/MocA family oxidoreductase [Phycisphaerales bacterium]
MKRLKAALMGLAGVGADYLAAIRSDEQFELAAVADTDPEVLRRQTDMAPARVYEDYRSLIVETAHAGLDLLFVALEPFQSTEFVQMAATRGIGVFHKAPCARSVREAQRLVDRFAGSERPLVVSRPWQFEPAYAALNRLAEFTGHVHAATVHVQTADTPVGWRGDSIRAGGGVLLNGAYEAVDMLVHLLGMPERVYAQCSAAVAPGAPRKYDTEDTATVLLGFGQERTACVTALRGVAEPSWEVAFVGTEGTVEVGADGVTITPRKGSPVKHPAARAANPAAHALSAFGASQLSNGRPLKSKAEEHLSTLAVIEAAYLSARTGAPESPGHFPR